MNRKPNSALAEQVHDALIEEAAEMELLARAGRHVARRTTFIVGFMVLLTLSAATMNLYLVFELTGKLSRTVELFQGMNGELSQMDRHMGSMTTQLTSIERSVAVMPPLAEHLQGVRVVMSALSGRLDRIRHTMHGVDNDMDRIGGGVQAMAGRFEYLEQHVYGISSHTGEMATPLRAMPFIP